MKHLKNIKAFENTDIKAGSSNKIVGKNTDFVAIFNTQTQRYDVFYKGKLLVSKEKYKDIVSYLN
jgi:hypothetical protein